MTTPPNPKEGKLKALAIVLGGMKPPAGGTSTSSPADTGADSAPVSTCPTCGHACPYCVGAQEGDNDPTQGQ